MEVNSSPGLEGIEAATQRDVAGAIVDYVDDNVQFPELDIRQRLTVSRGYGVVELFVGRADRLAGRTIESSGLRERDIVVLSLHREGKVIPNPRGTRELHLGDRLLCFGKYANVKGPAARRGAPAPSPQGPAPAGRRQHPAYPALNPRGQLQHGQASRAALRAARLAGDAWRRLPSPRSRPAAGPGASAAPCARGAGSRGGPQRERRALRSARPA